MGADPASRGTGCPVQACGASGATGATGAAGAPRWRAGLAHALAASLSFTACLAVLIAALPAAPAAAATILSHRAFYLLDLSREHPSGTIVDARGLLALEWTGSCEGWQVRQHTRLALSDSRDRGFSIDTAFTSLESSDGLAYRFNSETRRDGTLVQSVRGEATLDGPGGAGEAIFSRPEGRREVLPEGTLFPTAHNRLIIDAAARGERMVVRPVFDGATDDGYFEVSVLIGREVPAGSLASPGPPGDRPFRRMRMAWHDPDRQSGVPEWEVTVGLQDDGIARLLVLDYGDFVVRGVLESVEEVPLPDC